jgi:phosphoribosylamine--glycine ligase
LLPVQVLVLGSGGREHALVVGLRDDPDVTAVHVAPGNAGIAADADAVHVLDPTDGAEVVALAQHVAADLVVVGPEAPLVAGVADAVRDAGIACFGPSAAAARIEGSKAFAKQVMAAAGVPTAMAHVCDTADEVVAALDAFGPPYVVKDDGLAAGKGVVVTDDRELALAHAAACGRVLVEEYLDGPEVSLFCLTDGETVRALQPAQDFKRIFDADEGPNTGGMGAYTPLPWAPDGLVDDIVARVVQPTVDEMRASGTPFVGLLYAGLALTSRGLRVVEFNARFGDPETQAVLALQRTPLGALLYAASTGTLGQVEPPHWRPGAAVTVVLAAAGYPGSPRTGDAISGLEAAAAIEGVRVLHAGTAARDGHVVTAGGRVLSVTARGRDLAQARDRAYEAAALIDFDGVQYRRDIAAVAARGGP